MRMFRLIALIAPIVLAMPASAAPLPGHHLPDGARQHVRAQQVDIERLAAELTVDMKKQQVAGSVTVTFTPLREGLAAVAFDAAGPVVSSVELLDGGQLRALDFSTEQRMLRVALPPHAAPGDEVSVRIQYRAEPDAGLYFFPGTDAQPAEAWNYGEGGRHYGWLPLYNDTNDRFAVDFSVTVARPYTVLGNGTLVATRDNPDGTRTFRWVQDEPIPNYLLALDVGQFVAVPLRTATVGGREVPLTVWTHAGDEASAAFSFGATPDMVEFFSERFGFGYAWDKYDQVTLRSFSGAMETTTMVGFAPLALSYEGGPTDNGPELDLAFPSWTTEDTIAHELAHHWFGDLVTCRSMASIWLNESFASFAHTVWNGHVYGEDDLTYQRWRYLHHYLDFVRETGTVRPLEFYNYDASDDMYTMPITYLKGALVLHMLRHFLGDEDFYRSIAAYLERHKFAAVESVDFQRALEDVTGRKLDWFFHDWVRGGGGYPALQVSQLWVPERHALDLTIEQVQAELPFENLFDVPLDIEVVTRDGTQVHTVRLDEASLQVSLPVDSEPLMVNVDKGNWLVADIHQDKSRQALVYQLEHGDLAAALRAARQLAEEQPRDAQAVNALARRLGDTAAHWGLRQEAALDLGSMGGDEARRVLLERLADQDRRIRRAAVVALGRVGGAESAAALESVIAGDESEEVVGAAAVALGELGSARARETLLALLERDARFYDVYRIAALQGLAALEDPGLAATFARYTGPRFNQDIRLAAIDGWTRAAPQDAALSRTLKSLANDPDYTIRGAALAALGELHHAADVEFLAHYAAAAADPNLQVAAQRAAAAIRAFTSAN